MMNDFPILDGPRTDEFGRVIDDLGVIEPHIDEVDLWITMPMRLLHGPLTGWLIEVGPYSLDEIDIMRLCAAIATYHRVTRRRPDDQHPRGSDRRRLPAAVRTCTAPRTSGHRRYCRTCNTSEVPAKLKEMF